MPDGSILSPAPPTPDFTSTAVVPPHLLSWFRFPSQHYIILCNTPIWHLSMCVCFKGTRLNGLVAGLSSYFWTCLLFCYWEVSCGSVSASEEFCLCTLWGPPLSGLSPGKELREEKIECFIEHSKKTSLVVSVSSKHGIVLGMSFRAPPRCIGWEWVYFRLPIIVCCWYLVKCLNYPFYASIEKYIFGHMELVLVTSLNSWELYSFNLF